MTELPDSDDLAGSDHLARSSDHVVATEIASRAGRALMELRAASTADARSLGGDGDRLSHALIIDMLRGARPDDAVLSEEGAPQGAGDPEAQAARERGRRLWIVDPLDGTREYSEGRSDFAVHVALCVDAEARVGAVALPGEGLVLSTASPPTPPKRHEGAPRMLVSRTRPPALAERVARSLGAELVPMGSAGAKTMAVVRGIGDIYLHAGGQYEWDSAAPVAVALSAGLHATRLDGSPIRYGNADPWLPDLLVCRPELAPAVMAALEAATGP